MSEPCADRDQAQTHPVQLQRRAHLCAGLVDEVLVVAGQPREEVDYLRTSGIGMEDCLHASKECCLATHEAFK